MENKRAPLVLLAVNAAALAALALWARAGWPGTPNHLVYGHDFYCEALRPGWIKQPSNTWSCLAFILVGLIAAGRAKTRRGALFAVLISLIGPGSMALHASMTKVGGIFDVTSMFLFIGFCIAHNVGRLQPRLERSFEALYAAHAVPLTFMAALLSEQTPLIFGLLIGVFVATEAALSARGANAGREGRFLAAAAGFFAAGFLFWKLSEHSDGPICSAYSPFQGHAAWHVLCAFAAGALFLYLEPELLPVTANP